MDIQNSLDFFYAKLKLRSVSVHGMIVSYPVNKAIKHLLTGYQDNNMFIVPFDTNYCPWV